MRVMRANFDGSNVETLIVTGSSEEDRKDQRNWCVGIALDVEHGHVYWSQKGGDNANQGVIKRASLNIPAGHTADTRKDIEVLFANLPEPIDMELDLMARQMYWTEGAFRLILEKLHVASITPVHVLRIIPVLEFPCVVPCLSYSIISSFERFRNAPGTNAGVIFFFNALIILGR